MMFIVRGAGIRPEMPGIVVKLRRDTPPYVKDGDGKTDFFCVGETAAMAALRDAGWQVVELRDGWYEDGKGGGVAIWGQGKYWEIRSDPFTVAESVGPAPGSGPARGLGGDVPAPRRLRLQRRGRRGAAGRRGRRGGLRRAGRLGRLLAG